MEMARSVFAAAAVVVVMLANASGVRAQLASLDEATDPIEEAVEEAEGTVQDTVEETVEAGGAATGPAEEAVEGPANDINDTANDTVDTVGGTTGGTVDETSSTVQGTWSATQGGAGGGGGGAASGSQGGGQENGRNSGTGPYRRGPTGPETARAGAAAETEESARMARLLLATGSPSAPAAYLPFRVELTNDADDDGSYRDTESAADPGANVPFHVRLENAGPRELQITGIRNVTPAPVGSANETVCSDLTGSRLAPGATAACGFTVEGLAPGAGERVVAVIEVDVVEAADPSVSATVTDTSVVRTDALGVLGAVARRALDALASTGGRIALLVVLAGALGVGGASMLRMGQRYGTSTAAISMARAPVRGRAQRPSRRRPSPRPHARDDRTEGRRVGALRG
jgi:hypothetical protein